LAGEDGLEGTGAVGLVVEYGMVGLLGKLACGCMGKKGINHE
jgi:hypothetical protein